MSSESIYFECVVEYACNQIWLGKDTLYWLTRIRELEGSYIPTGDLAVKTSLCYFITQLHLHSNSVEHGEETFYNTKQFCEHFSLLKTLFPYSNVEMTSMDKKIQEWTTKINVTVPECEEMIKEMKIFLQPVYKKFENPQTNRAFEVYQKKLKSSKIHPNANALKEVFIWMFRGSTSDANKEWEEITKTNHPDVIQVKRNLASLNTSGPRGGPGPRNGPTTRSAASDVDLINTIPGCSTSVQEPKSIAVSEECNPVNSKGKRPLKGKNHTKRKERLTPLQHSSASSDSEDPQEYPSISHGDEMLESSDGVVGPSQEISDVTMGKMSRSSGKCQIVTTKIHVQEKPENPKQLITNEQNSPCKSTEKAINQTVEITGEEAVSRERLKMPTRQMLSPTCQLSKADVLVQATNAVSSNLAEATRNLKKIIKDPYEKKTQDSDKETQELTAVKRKKPKWLAPQASAGVLHWSSSDGISEDDSKKIGDKQPKKKKKKKQRRHWTAQEMDWIREGIKRYGIGNWAIILKNYPFVNRSSVDIKDKYRTMVRNAEI